MFIVCFALVLIVLLQAGKGAELGAAFGGASQTIFGSAGAMGFLSKLTTVAAVIFMITSLLLAFASSRQASSLMKERPAQSAPVESPGFQSNPRCPYLSRRSRMVAPSFIEGEGSVVAINANATVSYDYAEVVELVDTPS